jgi:Domain of Unknown Function (DUF1206)
MHVSRSSSGAIGGVRRAGEGIEGSHLFDVLARAGFVARGLVYGIIGVLALRLALGDGGKITNQQGALHTVANQPFGKFLLILVAIGLGGYSLWRLLRATIGHGAERSDSAFERVAAIASGLFYGAMCIVAAEIVMGSSGGGAGNTKKQTAGVFGWPEGKWIVAIAGCVMIGVALYQGYRGITKKFLEDSKTEDMGLRMKEWIGRIGTVGHLARMVVFGLVGIFLIKAAVDFRAGAAVGLDGALAKVLHHSYGTYMLAIVAAGLIAFALYSLSDARYRRI